MSNFRMTMSVFCVAIAILVVTGIMVKISLIIAYDSRLLDDVNNYYYRRDGPDMGRSARSYAVWKSLHSRETVEQILGFRNTEKRVMSEGKKNRNNDVATNNTKEDTMVFGDIHLSSDDVSFFGLSQDIMMRLHTQAEKIADPDAQALALASIIDRAEKIRDDDDEIQTHDHSTITTSPRNAFGCSTECRCTRAGLTGYARWCGWRYTGCEGLEPCDALDSCCKTHDECVGGNSLTSCMCHAALVKCAACVYDSTNSTTGFGECHKTKETAIKIMANVMYIMPGCFSEAERQVFFH